MRVFLLLFRASYYLVKLGIALHTCLSISPVGGQKSGKVISKYFGLEDR